jgi:hypothetical protein
MYFFIIYYLVEFTSYFKNGKDKKYPMAQLGQPTNVAHLDSPLRPAQNGSVEPNRIGPPYSLSLASLSRNPNLPRRSHGDVAATMAVALLRPTPAELGHAVVLNRLSARRHVYSSV